jgi:CO/xanthine dehydrogenase Mo-binding subunit
MSQREHHHEGWIGTSPSRVDGSAKVAGKARYIADIPFSGALESLVIRSEIARGKILSIDFDPAFDWSDIVIVSAKDVDHNEIALIEHDQPVLADAEIRHMYEPVVLLAGADREKLEQAKNRVIIKTEALEPVLNIEEALAAKTVISGTDNVIKRYSVVLGDAPAAISRCEVVYRGTYTVGHQDHLYIEPQGCVAWWDARGVHVVGSLQCPHYAQKALVLAFGIPAEKVDVSQAVTGGAFGGKEEYPSVICVHAALLSRKAGKPVRLIYDRKEDLECTTKRHPAVTHITTGCDKDGTLRAVQIKVVMDAGAYVTITPVVLSRGTLHACGVYKWEDVLVEACAVATNTPPTGAFRGFGAPQTLFAMERHLDSLAAHLGVEPMLLRKKNLLHKGAMMPTGVLLEAGTAIGECIEAAEKKSNYWEKRNTLGIKNALPGQRKVRGIGVSAFFHGAGFTGSGEERLKGKVAVDLLAGGRIRVRSGSTDIGQGTETVFRQIAAEYAAIPFEYVEVATPSTAHVPDSGPTVASRTVMIVGSIVAQAAKEIGEKVRAEMELSGCDFATAADRLIARDGTVSVLKQYKSPPGVSFDDNTYTGTAYPAYAWACDIAEVEVDLDTFEIKVLDFWSAVDVGRAIHPVMCEGQLEGGALQAIGWALWEEVKWKDGRILNPRMTTYIIPTFLDAPSFHTMLVEDPYEYGPGGAKGIGELPMDGGAPAIAAAVEHATGIAFDSIPISPERLFDAWAARSSKEVF